MVVHLIPAAEGVPSGPPRVGFIVARSVGGAVVRNRVKRRLRHLAAAELPATTPSRDVVVRALPAAATSPHRLGDDLASAWAQVMHRLSPGPARVSA